MEHMVTSLNVKTTKILISLWCQNKREYRASVQTWLIDDYINELTDEEPDHQSTYFPPDTLKSLKQLLTEQPCFYTQT